MNLIQQAVDRAEREPKVVVAPLLHMPSLGHVHSRSFRPTPLNPSRAPLAAAALAVLALFGGAALYVALARTHGERSAASAAHGQVTSGAPTPTPTAAAAAAAAATAAPETPAPAVPPAPPIVAAAAPAAVVAAAPAPIPLDEAKATVEAWARAWSERDVAGYLGYYGEGFMPENGASRTAWENSRRQMIERRRKIAVTVRDLRVEPVSEEQVVARYTQDYAADAYRESGTPKRLVLVRENAGWRIVAEGSAKAGAGAL